FSFSKSVKCLHSFSNDISKSHSPFLAATSIFPVVSKIAVRQGISLIHEDECGWSDTNSA
ncbi:MAG TPA: hypothetical protein PJ996_12005, partial [Nitrosomonas sp.]|nr:hypothetical protein [Nitrosomonas sp.]